MRSTGLVNGLHSLVSSIVSQVRHAMGRLPKFLKRFVKRTRRRVWKPAAWLIAILGDLLYLTRPFTLGTFSAHRIGHISAELGIQLAERAARQDDSSVGLRDFRAIDRQRPVEWWISVRSSTMVFMLGGFEFERDCLLEIEDGRVVHGEVAAV